jgi:hypothetical protein
LKELPQEDKQLLAEITKYEDLVSDQCTHYIKVRDGAESA